jgi:hypothetical protein
MRTVTLAFIVIALNFEAISGDTIRQAGVSAADRWILQVTSKVRPESPSWSDIYTALNKKYGQWRIPCAEYDVERNRYFDQRIRPYLFRSQQPVKAMRDQFLKRTELPKSWTLAGLERNGCHQ